MFDVAIPPMRKPADWAAAKNTLAPWLANAGIVLTTSELHALYYLGRYDVLISKSRLSELRDDSDFSIDHRTGRPVIGTGESLSWIMDCYPDGLIVADAGRWGNRDQVDDAVVQLAMARAEEVELPGAAMRAYVWHQPDDAQRTEACARLPAGLAGGVMARHERNDVR